MLAAHDTAPPQPRMLNKVPEATVFIWLIKIMCTTVGETAADYFTLRIARDVPAVARVYL